MAIVKNKPTNKKAGSKIDLSKKKGAQKTIQKKNQGDKKTGQKTSIPKDFKFDADARHEGTCVFFDRKGGFGFIKAETSGVVPGDKVMVYWKEIKSDDRWPYLTKGLKVEFGLKKQGQELRAKEVSKAGGDEISLQDDREEKYEYVGGDKNMRFLGNVKFYDFMKGFGYVKLQDGYDIPSDVPQEFQISRDEINSGDEAPRLGKDMEIEFGIFKNKKGKYGAFNVTLSGGDPVSRAVVEGRKIESKTTFNGTITLWARQGGFGWIKPDTAGKFPASVKTAIEKDNEKRKKKAEKKGSKMNEEGNLFFRRGDLKSSGFPTKNSKCTFLVYTDSQGVGACEVNLQ